MNIKNLSVSVPNKNVQGLNKKTFDARDRIAASKRPLDARDKLAAKARLSDARVRIQQKKNTQPQDSGGNVVITGTGGGPKITRTVSVSIIN